MRNTNLLALAAALILACVWWSNSTSTKAAAPSGVQIDASQAMGVQKFTQAGGWTAGVGLEWAFGGGDWSAFLEYDHMGFSSSRVTYVSAVIAGTTFPIEVGHSVNLVLVGINYRFYGGAPRF